jgi:hypothetical protein
MILKIIFFKIKNIILIYFHIKNILKKQYLTLSQIPLHPGRQQTTEISSL